LSKRVNMLMVAAAVLVMPALVLAGSAHQFAVGKSVASQTEANVVTVPLVVTNEANLAAMDIPLKFSEGVTLQAVEFDGTRTEYFDLKIANINNENRTVIIGLLPQITPDFKPDLEAGTGVVANLVFRIDDPTAQNVSLETFTTENPGHELTFVYHTDDAGQLGQYVVNPEFSTVSFSLTEAAGANLPKQFALNQNYPNPFNPSTTISFALPKPSHVELSIFNVLGQQVVKLADGQFDAGEHAVTFDASRMASGVYFYRIQTDENTETRKMMLLK